MRIIGLKNVLEMEVHTSTVTEPVLFALLRY